MQGTSPCGGRGDSTTYFLFYYLVVITNINIDWTCKLRRPLFWLMQGKMDEVNKNLEYVKAELEDVRNMLKQQEQLLASGRQRADLSQKTM